MRLWTRLYINTKHPAKTYSIDVLSSDESVIHFNDGCKSYLKFHNQIIEYDEIGNLKDIYIGDDLIPLNNIYWLVYSIQYSHDEMSYTDLCKVIQQQPPDKNIYCLYKNVLYILSHDKRVRDHNPDWRSGQVGRIIFYSMKQIHNNNLYYKKFFFYWRQNEKIKFLAQ